MSKLIIYIVLPHISSLAYASNVMAVPRFKNHDDVG